MLNSQTVASVRNEGKHRGLPVKSKILRYTPEEARRIEAELAVKWPKLLEEEKRKKVKADRPAPPGNGVAAGVKSGQVRTRTARANLLAAMGRNWVSIGELSKRVGKHNSTVGGHLLKLLNEGAVERCGDKLLGYRYRVAA